MSVKMRLFKDYFEHCDHRVNQFCECCFSHKVKYVKNARVPVL